MTAVEEKIKEIEESLGELKEEIAEGTIKGRKWDSDNENIGGNNSRTNDSRYRNSLASSRWGLETE